MSRTRVAAALLAALLLIPLLWSLLRAVHMGADGAAWASLWRDGQTLPAWRMTLWSGLASAALATAASTALLARCSTPVHLQRLLRGQGFLLAVPHAAFAIGLALLVAPGGWLLRMLSPWATGLLLPPTWATTQDPWGLGLIAVLALKETPFLLWAAGAELQRPEVARRLLREQQLAASLGYAPRQAWWRIVWPQLLPRLGAPLLAVLAYSLSVVDVALVIGPGSPPTLAALAWQWLQDANPQDNARGVAAAWWLAATVLACALAAGALLRAPGWRRRWSAGPAPVHAAHRAAAAPDPGAAHRALAAPGPAWGPALLHGIYATVLAALLLGSVTGSWPFPQLLPARWTTAAWFSVADSLPTLWTTLWLALASATTALLWVVAWLEWAPPRWQRRLQALAYAPLLLPALLWTIGLHRLALDWDLDARAGGLWLAHSLACLPYVLLSAAGPYAGFDRRPAQLAAALGQRHWRFLLRVKWPMLRAPLAAAFAVGFAVSVAQYLPTLYVGGGRFASVTTEAVALSAGGQRSLSAAYAWLQWLLPALVFAAAARAARPRRFASAADALGTIRP